jgi:alpha-ketoglutarate-dependent taurine dioxygenase
MKSSTAQGIILHPLAPFGALIEGIPLDQPQSETVCAQLRSAYDRHALLLFRNQNLDKDDLYRTASIFGRVSDQGEAPGGFNLVSNLSPKGMSASGEMTLAGGDGELQFHFDHCFQETVLHGIGLYAVEVPPEGGDTLFTDMRAVTRKLPPTILQRLEGKLIRHKSTTRTGNPEANHPVLYPHPQTGEAVVFFSKMHAREIIGISDEEFKSLANEIAERLESEEHIYRHKWRRGDVVVWDNLALQHARETFDPKYRRHLNRVQIGQRST